VRGGIDTMAGTVFALRPVQDLDLFCVTGKTMAFNENLPGFPPEGRVTGKSPRTGLHPLHEAALRLAEIGRQRPRAKSAKTKDLINLLLCHGARAWRYSQPEAGIHLHVTCPDGKVPVTLRLR
jgi:hypothetical protein